MVEKYKLKLAVGCLILLITIWLIRLCLFLNIDIIIGQLLLPFAIVLILRTLWSREKKPAIEKELGSKFLGFFIKSLIVSFLAVFVGYYWWWYPLYVEPYLPEFYYSSFAAGMAFILFLLVPLAFLIAGILTIVYVILKKQKMKTQ